MQRLEPRGFWFSSRLCAGGTTPYFEKASRAYAWMNDIVCVGRLRSFGAGRAQYDVFELV
jgi:hypothetical protein